MIKTSILQKVLKRSPFGWLLRTYNKILSIVWATVSLLMLQNVKFCCRQRFFFHGDGSNFKVYFLLEINSNIRRHFLCYQHPIIVFHFFS